MSAIKKQDVFDPMALVSTPGAELVYIFENHQIFDYNERLGVKNLKEKENLSKKIIAKAEKILGMKGDLSDLLAKHEENYKAHKEKSRISYSTAKKHFTKLRPILPLLKDEFSNGYDRLNDVLDYFDVDSPEEIFERSERQAALFRKQNGIEPDPINLYGWLRRGELDYAKMNLPAYDEDALQNWIESRDWDNHLTDSEYFKNLPSILSKFGVGLSLVPYLRKTVYGAIRWIDGHPLIEISDRNHDLPSCWFTLFHELGHALLHRDTEVLEGNINESSAISNSKEKEANKFANKYLFNGDDLRKAVFNRVKKGIDMNARELSIEFGVNPMFSSYWLLKAQYQPSFQRRYSIDFTDDFQ